MNDTKKAVIYARVSSTKQVSEGSGLGSQETRCREYAKYKSYDVTDVFTDDMSGGVTARPGMNAMLKHLRQNRSEKLVVIIDDISRLARGLEAHLALRTSINDAGGVLESPSIEFGESSDAILVENLLASVAQHQREKNSEQVVNRMRSRLLAGYQVFGRVPGYRYERRAGHGKILVRDEPTASVMVEALEGFAAGRFQTIAEVRRFLEAHPDFPTPAGRLNPSRVRDHLGRVAYAGYVEAPQWDVSLRKGHHEPLISFETHLKIRERLEGRATAPARANLGEDFALRGFVDCGDCGEPLRSCWSKGRNARYPYYLCQTKDCESYGKSIRRDQIEGEFETLLKTLQPSQTLFAVASAMFKDIWEQRMAMAQEIADSVRKDIASAEKQIAKLVERVMGTDSAALASAYETKIKALEVEKVRLTERLGESARPKSTFEDQHRTAMEFLANPWNLWRTERIEDRRAVLKLAFLDRLAYSRNEGFRTAEMDKISLPFRLLGDHCGSRYPMVEPGGIEPPTS